jgi:hypothetical protein
MPSSQEGEQEGKKVPLSVPFPMYQYVKKYVKEDAVNMVLMDGIVFRKRIVFHLS